jgi:hypothetical protein
VSAWTLREMGSLWRGGVEGGPGPPSGEQDKHVCFRRINHLVVKNHLHSSSDVHKSRVGHMKESSIKTA